MSAVVPFTALVLHGKEPNTIPIAFAATVVIDSCLVSHKSCASAIVRIVSRVAGLLL